MRFLRGLMLASAALVIVNACARSPEPPRQPLASFGQASDSIANTICAHQQRCGEIEADDYQECVGEVTEEAVEVLEPDACEEGISEAQLESCLTRVSAATCDESVELDDLDVCRADVLCEV